MKKNLTKGLLTFKKHEASGNMQGILKSLFTIIFFFFISYHSFGQQNLMIRDCQADETALGAEPDVSCSPIYTSDGIKITQNPYAGYSPYPFTTGAGDAWSLVPDEDAEYRDPTKYSKPNWIYVKVSNVGNAQSSGEDILKLYWAKASTGLSWPMMWDLHYYNTHPGCTGSLYLGDEITLPRKKWSTLSPGEKVEVVGAFQQLDLTYYQDGVSWWDKQDQIHQATHVHNGPAFLTWHREFVNRFELLLQGVVPHLRLPYWDWTITPDQTGENIIGVNSIFHFGLATGAPTTPVGFPFNTFDNGGNCICANTRGDNPFCSSVCSCPIDPAKPPTLISRGLNFFSLDDDATILSSSNGQPQDEQYFYFRNSLENNHNNAHSMFGAGNIGCPHSAFEDPFIFLLHSNVDKIFAKWQRHLELAPINAHLFRLDPSQTVNGVYGLEGLAPIETCPTDFILPAQLINPLEPWANRPNPAVIAACLTPTRPWMTPDNEDLPKTSLDPSVVIPPLYDDALLTIPVLQPGESVIMQMPWYPVLPGNYSCFSDQEHFCILARIIEPSLPNDGMFCTEIANVGANAACNNNIAWKNIQLYDVFPNSQFATCVLMRNMQEDRSFNRLRIKTPETGDLSFFQHGTAKLVLPEALFNIWVQGGSVGGNIEINPENQIILLNENAWIGNILLAHPGEEYEVCIKFNLNTIPADGKAFHINLEQTDDFNFLGGEQFKLRYGLQHRASAPSAESFSHTLYPNPNNGIMQMDYTLNDNEKGELNIYDYAGKNVATYYLAQGKNTLVINEPQLSNGVYFYKIKVNDKIIDTNKLVIIK